MTTGELVIGGYEKAARQTKHYAERLGRLATAFFSAPAEEQRATPEMSQEVLVRNQVRDRGRFEQIKREGEVSNMLRLEAIKPTECILLELHPCIFEDQPYGQSRRMLLQRWTSDDTEPLFRAFNDNTRIYDKYDKHLMPFQDNEIVAISAARPSDLIDEEGLKPYLDYGQAFSFRTIGGEVTRSSYHLSQISVAHDGEVHELLTPPPKVIHDFNA